MSNHKTLTPLTDPLRNAIIESQTPLLVLAKATGIARASLIRFRRGETSLRLDVADRLATYFGMRLAAAPRPKGTTKRKAN